MKTQQKPKNKNIILLMPRKSHNIDDSVAYGHPSILEPVQSSLPSPASRPAKRAREGELILETNKRHKKHIKANLDRR